MIHYLPADLVAVATRLLEEGGLDLEKAAVVAETLMEGDLLGHDTHGLAQLPSYLEELKSDAMTHSGTFAVLSDHGAVALWDGLWLPGPWLVAQALDEAARRACQFGISMIAVRRSHHTACLQAYLKHITDQGLVAFVSCSDPSGATVAPFGGLDPVFQPDPFAVGIPTEADPILIDMSSSITSNSMVSRRLAAGQRLPGKWVQDADGEPSDDPSVLTATPPGTLLLTGGHDHGYKGQGLALMVESMAFGLSGYGRANAEDRWGASFLVQVIDPAHFDGIASFVEQSSELVQRVHAARPKSSDERLRVPGERALTTRDAALENGIELLPGISEQLDGLAALYGVAPAYPMPPRGER